MYLIIYISNYRRVPDQLDHPSRWMMFINLYTATTLECSSYFVMYNIQTGWASDRIGERETFGNNEVKKKTKKK